MRALDGMPIFLMCPPEHFAIGPRPGGGYANDMSVEGARVYSRDPVGFRAQAMRQWESFRDILVRELGAEIIEIAPAAGLADQVFAADASISLVDGGDARALLSRFTYSERQAEVEAQREALCAFDPQRTFTAALHNIEGCGDNVYDALRDVFWSGCTPKPTSELAQCGRSDARAHSELAESMGVEVVSLEVRRPFFHLDTAVAVLPLGHVMCCRDGLSGDAFERLCERAFDAFDLPRAEYLIEVSREDAALYACNVVARGERVVLPPVSEALNETIRRKGYEPIPADLSRFILSGGGPHCLTNRINEARSSARARMSMASRTRR